MNTDVTQQIEMFRASAADPPGSVPSLTSFPSIQNPSRAEAREGTGLQQKITKATKNDVDEHRCDAENRNVQSVSCRSSRIGAFVTFVSFCSKSFSLRVWAQRLHFWYLV